MSIRATISQYASKKRSANNKGNTSYKRRLAIKNIDDNAVAKNTKNKSIMALTSYSDSDTDDDDDEDSNTINTDDVDYTNMDLNPELKTILDAPKICNKNLKMLLEFYVGVEKYRILENNSILDNHNAYLKFVISNMHGFITARNLTTKLLLKDNACRLIAQAFFSILDYNNILHIGTCKLIETYKSVLLGEPCFYRTQKTSINDNIILLLYFNRSIINSFIFQYYDDSLTLKFAETIMDQKSICSAKLNVFENLKDTKPLDYQSVIFRLFIIADHLATHYMSEYIRGSTDWIHHHSFLDLEGATTTHLVFNINASIVTSSAKPMQLINLSNNATAADVSNIGTLEHIENPISALLNGTW